MTRPRERDWREVIVERYSERSRKRGYSNLQVKANLNFLAMLDRAAQTMAVNRSTFVRRALAVHIAHVLQRDVRTILQHCPSPKPWGFDQFPGKDKDFGIDIEHWCPHPGCDGSHLR